MNEFWGSLKRYTHMFVGAMLMEPKNGGQGISLGRVCFLAVLGLMGTRWLRGQESLDTLLSVWYVLAGYVLGGKVIEGVKGHLGAPKVNVDFDLGGQE